ncbi:MAG TPA: hypothetical protein VEI54_10610 [Candidatus Limnocylindrales bacterium]|nr:hypothetical protein [Candidatus Limnocylindrales bacterium]
MLSPARLTELLVEVIFVFLGVLVVWLGVTGNIRFDPRSVYWLAISMGAVAWGLLALARPGLWWARWQKWNRGGSLILLGLIMLGISRAPVMWIGKLLAAGGLVLFLRGVLGSVLILKQR